LIFAVGGMSDAALSRLEGVCARLEALEVRLGSGLGGAAAAAPAAGGAPAQGEAAFVKAFDDLTSGFFAPLESGAKTCGPDVEKIIGAYKEGLTAQRAMLVIAVGALWCSFFWCGSWLFSLWSQGNNKKPDAAKLQEVLKPTAAAMEKIESLKDRRSKQVMAFLDLDCTCVSKCKIGCADIITCG
jgi:hypothetical protein